MASKFYSSLSDEQRKLYKASKSAKKKKNRQVTKLAYKIAGVLKRSGIGSRSRKTYRRRRY